MDRTPDPQKSSRSAHGRQPGSASGRAGALSPPSSRGSGPYYKGRFLSKKEADKKGVTSKRCDAREIRHGFLRELEGLMAAFLRQSPSFGEISLILRKPRNPGGQIDRRFLILWVQNHCTELKQLRSQHRDVPRQPLSSLIRCPDSDTGTLYMTKRGRGHCGCYLCTSPHHQETHAIQTPRQTTFRHDEDNTVLPS